MAWLLRVEWCYGHVRQPLWKSATPQILELPDYRADEAESSKEGG